jgi:hypothetical protein
MILSRLWRRRRKNPREEHAELGFPYAEQPRYRFFDHGYIRGFYRNSVHDIDAHEFFPRQSSNESMKPTAPLLRIALEMILIVGWQMIRPQSTGKAQMKTILMLIVGLMLAGCGSMENHVRKHGVASTSGPASQDRGNRIAVDTICACP